MKRTIKKTIMLAVLLLAVSQGSFAQSTIFGSVVDAKTGIGIPGASVTVKGTTIGVVTNSSGNFGLMNVPDDATLQVSFIGYKTIEMAVENQTRFDIKLEPDIQVLDEVVITARVAPPERVVMAFGIERDPRTLPYAVTHISGDKLRQFNPADPLAALTYFVPNFNGRGSISWTEGNTPSRLVVIDGIPTVGDLSIINPEDIESVTILRGINAAMLYGSQGIGGAIIITTKKPRK